MQRPQHGDHGTLAHCRMFGGELRVRDRAGDSRDVITSVERSTPSGWVKENVVRVGDVVRVRGISAARTGSWLGEAIPGRVTRQFPSPALESVVEPADPAMRGRLCAALRELADADPLINLRVDEEQGEIAVSLYGEVQKEVIADPLGEQFGVAVTFRPTVTVHLERITGAGASLALMTRRPRPTRRLSGFASSPRPVARLSCLITGTGTAGDAVALTGTLATRSVQPLLAQLPELTSGEGVFTAEVTRYTPVTGSAPLRARIGPDPLNREEWFRARPR